MYKLINCFQWKIIVENETEARLRWFRNEYKSHKSTDEKTNKCVTQVKIKTNLLYAYWYLIWELKYFTHILYRLIRNNVPILGVLGDSGYQKLNQCQDWDCVGGSTSELMY